MNPVYQGQIDIFCAPYAVINGIRHIRSTRLLACREMFHTALLEFSRDRELFQAALQQKTDYIDWVDKMLQWQTDSIATMAPFASSDDAETIPLFLWEVIESWLDCDERRAVLFQFVRQLLPSGLLGSDPETSAPPQCIRHWTCGCRVLDETLHLYDSSLDLNGKSDVLHAIPFSRVITDESRLTGDAVCIIPHSLRLLRPRD